MRRASFLFARNSEMNKYSNNDKTKMKTYQVDKNGYYGRFGGAYIPEILHQCVQDLRDNYLKVLESDDFKREFDQLLRDYVGRPSRAINTAARFT